MEIKILIDDRIVGFWKRNVTKRRVITAMMLCASIPLGLYAASTVGEYGLWVFSPGDTISASQMNDNFDLLGEHMTRYEDAITVDDSGNVGIGTTSPSLKVDVRGDARVSGTFRVGEHYTSTLQSVTLSVGTETWVKLATIPNNHNVRFYMRNGSENSEEIAEIMVFGTYFISSTGISVDRQTYYDHLREVRVTGSDGGSKTVYVKVRSDTRSPTLQWRAISQQGAVTIHNTVETPSGGAALIVSGNLVHVTNAGMNIGGNVGIGTTTPEASLDVNGRIIARQGFGELFTAPSGGSLTFTVVNGHFYRMTVKASHDSVAAYLGTYLIYGLGGQRPPTVLTVAETESIDWTFSYQNEGENDQLMTVTSNGTYNQARYVILEALYD